MTEPGRPDDEGLPATATDDADRWELIRDLAVFQLKLLADAVRDVLLSPISLVAGIIDLAMGSDERGYFYQVFRLGRRTDEWIDLFDQHMGERDEDAPSVVPSLDELLGRVEQQLVEQVERGGLTASAKSAIDKSLDAITREK